MAIEASKLQPGAPTPMRLASVIAFAARKAYKERDLPTAEALWKQSLQHDPTNAENRSSLGVVLAEQDRTDEAMTHLREAERQAPDSAIVQSNLGYVLFREGAMEAALSHYRRSLAIAPDRPLVRLNAGLSLLRMGQYEEGFSLYRRHVEENGLKPDLPLWRGEPLQGQRLLIWLSEGYGDMLQMLRFLPQVQAAGARPLLLVPAPLLPLLQALPGVEVYPRRKDGVLPPADLHVPDLALPSILGTGLHNVPPPWPIPVPPAVFAPWRRVAAGMKGLKVGFAWAGNPKHGNNARRSMALSSLAPLLRTPGVQFVSLQKDQGDGDEALLSTFSNVLDAGPALRSFADTAGALQALDLLITVDTAVAHLALTLGRPTWIMLPTPCDWRWIPELVPNPWYPQVRLFCQERRGDWHGVVAAAAAALALAAGGAGV